MVPAGADDAGDRLRPRGAFPLEAGRRVRAIAVHSAGALLFSFAHIIGLLGVRFLLWENGGK